nr:hypothetical protein L203_01686 [Cryptococcus depauperatus CBS 7841]
MNPFGWVAPEREMVPKAAGAAARRWLFIKPFSLLRKETCVEAVSKASQPILYGNRVATPVQLASAMVIFEAYESGQEACTFSVGTANHSIDGCVHLVRLGWNQLVVYWSCLGPRRRTLVRSSCEDGLGLANQTADGRRAGHAMCWEVSSQATRPMTTFEKGGYDGRNRVCKKQCGSKLKALAVEHGLVEPVLV